MARRLVRAASNQSMPSWQTVLGAETKTAQASRSRT